MKISPSACIQLKEGTHIAKCVLMPGDPLRGKYIAENYLDNAVLFNDVRNMFGYTGTFQGKEVSVMGSGMGIPSMLIYAHELYNYFGVESIIRVGTAGGLQDEVSIKDVVIAKTASTNSSCVSAYDLAEGPRCDNRLFNTAMIAANELGVKAAAGSIYTTDYFYHPDSTINKRAKAAGHLAVEMETAGLYLCAQANHKRALSVLSISDHIFKGGFLSPQELRESFNDMMEIALVTAVCSDF